MAKYAWPKALQTMADLMADKQLPITQAEMDQIVNFYLTNSPQMLPTIRDDLQNPLLSFKKQAIGELTRHRKPEVTSVKLADIDGDGKANELIVTDNLNQSVSWLKRVNGKWKETILSKGNAPVNTTPMDIDGDGDTDFGISYMGIMHPNEKLIGEPPPTDQPRQR